MKVQDFLNEVENTYSKYFTNSRCEVTLSTKLYRDIYIRCYLANNKRECANGYFENDMFNICFMLDTENGELEKSITLVSELPNNLRLKSVSKGYLTKPENDYLAYSHRNLSFRKTTGDYKKILKSLDSFFSKLSTQLKKDISEDNIHKHHIDLLKSKLI